jgi:RNA polymerase sigma factor (sigma-70 family)
MAQLPVTRVTLLARLKRFEDDSAWSEFLSLYGPAVYAYLRKRGLQEADAVDVTQEVFRSVAGSMNQFEYQPHRGSFRAWLFTIVARHLSKFRHRSARATPPEQVDWDSVVDQQDPEADWELSWQRRLFEVALQRVQTQVSEATFQAFTLTAVDGRSGEDVAEQLGITRAAVYLARGRVMARLQSIVTELEASESLS